MSESWIFVTTFIVIFLWVVLFSGEPDIIDGVVHRLMNTVEL